VKSDEHFAVSFSDTKRISYGNQHRGLR